MNTTDLQDTFDAKGSKFTDIEYRHPQSEKIIEEALEIIRESETGAHLIQVAKKGNIPLHVFKSEEGKSSYIPDSNAIYIGASEKTKEAGPSQVIAVILTLREAEQEMIGLSAPDPADMLNYATVMHTKNLDALVYMCKVIHEMEVKKTDHYTVLLDEVKSLGHNSLYQAYVTEEDETGLAQAYVDG